MNQTLFCKTENPLMNSNAWSLHERMSFYWTLASFSFFVDDILVIKRAYFNKEEVDILNNVVLDHLIFLPDVPYNSIDAESIWALTLQATPHTDVSYAEMVSRLRKFELGTCGKYGIDEINSMHKYAIESVILKLGSLHFHETDEPSIAAAYGDQLSYMKVPQETGAANKVVSAENLAIIKALLKYTVHKRLFRQSTDAHMLFLSLPLQAQSVISSFSDTEMCLWMLVCKHGSTMIEYIGTCISRILDTYIKEANNLDAEDYGYLLAHGAIPKGYSAKILKRIVEDICLLPSKTNAKKAAVALPSKQPSIPEHRRSSVSITSNINITNVLDQLIKDADTASTCNTRTPEEAIPLSASTSSLVFSETKHIPLSLPTSSTINIPLVNTTRRRRASITRPDIGSARHYKPPSARSVSLSLPQTLSLNLLEDFLQKP